MSLRPTSSSGAWAVSLAATFILVFIISPFTARFVGENRAIVGMFSGTGFAIVGTAALVVGLISVIKNKDRSIFVILSLLVGLYALLFLAFLIGVILDTLSPNPINVAALRT